jgi:hypothetical protein
MQPEVQERFVRIENNLEVTTQALHGVIDALQGVVGGLDTTARAIAAYVMAADERMTRTEQSLNLLIRAISTEQGNGKQHS